jgi:hypothetical protein
MAMDSGGPPAAGRGPSPGRGRHTGERRHPERGVLQRVVGAHLETFLAEARARGGGAGLPRFVERELRAFLGCGVMASGFARFRCAGCAREILVAFSCCPQLEAMESSPQNLLCLWVPARDSLRIVFDRRAAQ